MRIILLFTLVTILTARAQPPPEQLLKRFDADGDGKMDRQEFPAKRLFEAIDTDQDGFITLTEDRAYRAQREKQPANKANQTRPRTRLLESDFTNVSYGPHERNVFDLWKTPGNQPAPLVIFYHGGGFRGGDKRSLNPALLQGLLDRGISVAAANYRLTDTAPFPAPMHDSARALQTIRLHAEDYGIDPTRIGATGGSAGAGISQWLAFHDDLAQPDHEDPVARQSTRLKATVVYAAQTSYDPRFLAEFFNTTQPEGALLAFYGVRGPEDYDDPKFTPLFEEASPINHLTADDPPVFLFYPQANTPLSKDSPGQLYIHHPKFGFLLKEKAEELGVTCVLRLKEDFEGNQGRQAVVPEYVAFFAKHLGAPTPTSD